jgi:hypothetical protein
MADASDCLPLRWVGVLALAALVCNSTSAQTASTSQVPVAFNKNFIDNGTVLVYETTFAPGAEASSRARPYRIVRALTDGTLLRIYADGRTETIDWKAGDVREVGPDDQYKSKNIGKSEFKQYVVIPKAKTPESK